MGCGQVKEPLRCKECVRPTLMVAPTSAPAAMVAFAQNAAQTHPEPSVERNKGTTRAMLKVDQPAPQRPIDVLDDDRHRFPLVASGFGPQRVLEFLHTLRTRPMIAPLEVIAEKVNAAALRGIDHPGLVRVEREPRGLRPRRDQGERALRVRFAPAQNDEVASKPITVATVCGRSASRGPNVRDASISAVTSLGV